MTSLGDFCTAGTIRCNKIIATTADLPSGGGGGGDIDVDSITFNNTWKIYLDANSNFILENEAQNVISLSGDAHTGKVTLHDFDINDLANLDTNRPLNFTGDDLKIQSSNNSNIFVGGSNRINPRNNGASIGIGYQACDSSNLSYNVAIGYQAGRQEQGFGFPFQGQSVAVGFQAGESFQKNHGVALGAYAGRINQQEAAVACGFFSGNDSQGKYSIAVGNATGQSSQGDFGVALGASSGNIHQGIESLACGSFSGHKNLGYQSVALGHRASYNGGDFSNTIVINATGTNLDPEGTDRTYIKPIREGLNNDFLFYDSISGEVTRSVAVNFTSNLLLNNQAGVSGEVLTSQGNSGTPVWVDIYDLLYPVNSVKIMYGVWGGISGQTWVEFGQGRTLVGLDAGDADFNAIGLEDGFKEITLTEAQMPTHTHTQNAHSHAQTRPTARGGASTGVPTGVDELGINLQASPAQTQNTIATNQDAGGNQPHNNLQPYIVVRYYRRTA